MARSLLAAFACALAISITVLAQPSPPTRPIPNLPPGVGARPMPPPATQAADQDRAHNYPAAPSSPSTSLISSLDSTAPFVQAFDFILMLFCGAYCLRIGVKAKSGALKLMALACFVSAIILLGFFLSATYHEQALIPLPGALRFLAYVVARLLAPFELLLFAIAIVLLARRVGR